MLSKLQSIDRDQFRNNLLKWFKENKRDLPWRKATNWYPIFLSEIMLQQTQVEQALPYYTKFMSRFPDIFSLSQASEQEVLSLWAGLGYYSRARNLLKAARIIVSDYNAQFPQGCKAALSIPGIGKYSASAILSIAFNEPHAVVDGNVYRVISRLFTIKDDIRLNKTQKKIQSISDHLISVDNPGDYNEAMMELGAVICRKQTPECKICPVQSFCEAYKTNSQKQYPYKSPASPKRKANHYVCIIENNGKYLLVQRPASGMLASLWEFPVIEVPKLNLNRPQIKSLISKKYNFQGKLILEGSIFRHQYSHINLTYQPVIIQSTDTETKDLAKYKDNRWCDLDNLKELPMHNAHLKLIKWLKNLNQ